MKLSTLLYVSVLALALSSLRGQIRAQTYSNIQITTDSNDQSETAVAVDPMNNNHLMVVWNDFKDAGTNGKKSKAGYAFSTNAGESWSVIGVIPEHTLDGTQYMWGFDPSCTFDRTGNAYYCYVARKIDLTQELGPVHLSRTNNNGSTWNHTRVGPGLTGQDKPFMDIDNTGGNFNGRIYISWVDFTSNQSRIKFALSLDGGTTFPTVLDLTGIASPIDPYMYSEPVSLDPPAPPLGHFVQGPVPAVAPNGDVYVIWLDAEGGIGSSGTIKMRRGIPSQTSPYISFGNEVTVANITVVWKFTKRYYRISTFPTIAVDKNTGYVYVAYTQIDAGNNLNVYYTYSMNNGQNWSTPANASDPLYNSYAQFFAWLSLDPTGRIGLVFCDDRNDPSPAANPPLIDVYYTESIDNGFAFSTPNTRISTSSSDGSQGSFTTDYQGVASTVGFFFPAWNDFRNNNADAYFARVNRPPTSDTLIATAYNSGRRLVRTSNGDLHLVYPSNEEIYYAKSTDGGTTWTDHTRLSTGNAKNGFPSIVATSSKRFVVWQRYAGVVSGKHRYEIWLAKNLGSTWSTNYTNYYADFTAQTDPLPTLTYKQSNVLLMAYRYADGILTPWSTNDGQSWSTTGLGASGDRNISISLSTAPPTSTVWGSYDNGSAAKAASFYSSWSSSTNISNGATTTNNQFSSVETDANNYVHAAWQAIYNPTSLPAVVHRRRTSSWSATWDYFWDVAGLSYYHPAATGLGTTKAAIIWYDSGNNVKKAYYNGSSWTVTTVATGGKYAAVSAGSTSAKYVWTTADAIPPYEIKTGSELLQSMLMFLAKAGDNNRSLFNPASFVDNSSDADFESPLSLIYHRAAAMEDSLLHGEFVLEMGEISVATRSGKEIPLNFIPVVDSLVSLNMENLFAHLATEPVTLPGDAEQLIYKRRIYKQDAEKFHLQSNVPVKIRVKLCDADSKATLTNLDEYTLSELDSETRLYEQKTASITHFAGKNVIVVPEVEGLKLTPTTVLGLHHLHIVTGDKDDSNPMRESTTETLGSQAMPNDFSLMQNYPNPFNPETMIAYALPQGSHVRIEVYNVLGQRIATLVDADMPAGNHSVRWNGRNAMGEKVSAGIYLCRIQAGKFVKTQKMTLLL